MPVEFIGWIAGHTNSEVVSHPGPTFDPAVVRRTAEVHEVAGFDRVLIGTHSIMPDGVVVGTYAAAVTDRLGFLLSHRPGFAAPTVAARQIATFDHVCGGRLALHLIAGSTEQDQQRDGDYLDHRDRYRRMTEYTKILQRAWTHAEPFDFDGEFYRMTGAWSAVRCMQTPHVPLYGGGGSDDALSSLAPLVDCFMLWGEPLAETAEVMTRVRTLAAGRAEPITFSLSTRPIIAATEDEAWAKAHRYLAIANARFKGRTTAPSNVGSQRLLAAAERSELHDSCLWTALAAATGAPGNSTCLVGTPDTVAEALVAYYDLGATTLLIRGWDPLVDAEDYGRELIPRVRALVAKRDRQARAERQAN